MAACHWQHIQRQPIAVIEDSAIQNPNRLHADGITGGYGPAGGLSHFAQGFDLSGHTLDRNFGVADLPNAVSRNPAVWRLGLTKRFRLQSRHELVFISGELTVLTTRTTAGDESVTWLIVASVVLDHNENTRIPDGVNPYAYV